MDKEQVDNEVREYENVTVVKDPKSAIETLKQLIQQTKGATSIKKIKSLTEEQEEDFKKEFDEVPKKKKRGKPSKSDKKA